MEDSLLFKFFSLLPDNATHAEIENAYKSLAQIYHPDRNPGRILWANEKMKQLNDAKALLLDPSKRDAFIQGFKNKKRHETNQLNDMKRLKNENLSLVKTIQKNNQETGILALLLLLFGGALIASDTDHKPTKRRKY